MAKPRKKIPDRTPAKKVRLFRRVKRITPTTCGVFKAMDTIPEALFSDEMDAELWASLLDVVDSNRLPDGWGEQLSETAAALLSRQTTPLAKVKRS
jgi:hypothetical protein